MLPLTLLEIRHDDIAKNHYVVSVQQYITLCYNWLSFTGVACIGLSRCKKIKGGIVNLDYNEY